MTLRGNTRYHPLVSEDGWPIPSRFGHPALSTLGGVRPHCLICQVVVLSSRSDFLSHLPAVTVTDLFPLSGFFINVSSAWSRYLQCNIRRLALLGDDLVVPRFAGRWVNVEGHQLVGLVATIIALRGLCHHVRLAGHHCGVGVAQMQG